MENLKQNETAVSVPQQPGIYPHFRSKESLLSEIGAGKYTKIKPVPLLIAHQSCFLSIVTIEKRGIQASTNF